MEKKTCFIIMPFTKVKATNLDLDEKTLTYIYENMIYKAVSDFKLKNRKVFNEISRYNSKIGSIISGITRNLNESDLVIADLTGLNPNVMYELGVRHTLKRGTIIITQDITSIPSDLRDYMCVEYKYSANTIEQQDNYDHFKVDLHKSINELFQTNKFDSPVLSYLKGKEKYWHEDELKIFKTNLIISKYLFQNFNDVVQIVNDIDKKQTNIPLSIINALLNNISNALNDLNISFEDLNLYEDLQNAKAILQEVLKKAFITDYFGSIFNQIPDDESKKYFPSILNINDKSFLNHFELYSGKYEQVSFKEIFSNKGDFYKIFLLSLEEYIDDKILEFKISNKELKKIIQ
ncbi:MAG: hypothetical protein J0L69_01210 [Bacteroidetes bacterium]|nr:hypothetical protein [Bacteroidota bacterium]